MNLQIVIENLKAWAIIFAPKLATAIFALIIGLWLIKKIGRILVIGLQKRHLEVSLQSFLKSLVTVGLKVVLFITVAGMLGLQSTSFIAILGAAGLAIGLALQGSLSNFAGGVLILVFKPFKVGDIIEAQSMRGEVKEILIFNTILLMQDLQTVILPNGILSNGTIINFNKNGIVRVDLNLKVDGGYDLESLKAKIQEMLSSNPKILKEPVAFVGLSNFVEGGYQIAVRPHCTPENYWDVYHSVNEALLVFVHQNKLDGPSIRRLVLNS